MAVKVSKIGKSAVRIGLNEGSILRNKDGKIRGNTDMFAEEDCIDIPEYKRADGTIVEAHTRCIDRVFTTDETRPEDVKRLSAESNIRSSIMDKLGTPDFDYTKDAYDLLKNINSELGVDPDFTYKPAIDMALSGLDETRPIKSLSDLENAFIKAYTDEDTYYVNLGLREGDELTVSDKVYAMGLQSALAKAPKVGKTRLYRDVQNLDEIAGVDNFNSAINLYEQNIGGVINFDAFTSTTRRTGNFTLRPSMSIKYIIDTSENSKGVDVSGLSKHDDESEVLFPMDSKFEITKVEKDYKGFIAAVYLKEISSPKKKDNVEGSFADSVFNLVDEARIRSGRDGGFFDKVKNHKDFVLLRADEMYTVENSMDANRCETNSHAYIKDKISSGEGDRYFPVGGYLVTKGGLTIEHWWVYDKKEDKHMETCPFDPSEEYAYAGVVKYDIQEEIEESDWVFDVDFFRSGNFYYEYFDKNEKAKP